ncbi:MAG TPA: transporter suffix domain-containing protein [Alphaproteobacteria bacterium]|nr:transporter suffix domain-containing protein [Alphaproteobacteria bacterium]
MTDPEPDGGKAGTPSAAGDDAAAVAPPRPRGKIRKTLGYAFLILCAVGWIAFAAVPFLGFSAGTTAAALGILLVVAEGAFVIGIALLGREILRKIRALLKSLIASARES